ncbi:VRR-NUC domain-containing protein [Salinibius halmophilus]|uniref:VRR-NUC domain-containing protein n=1 Tax=Salinibius halmophilus TaxID=1853216 RepID=UPI000E668BB2|nr:VRR-NUC domain-containing protein [Salinibius halmophilus]
MQPASIEDAKYYWRNASLLIDWVWQHYQPLLSADAVAFYQSWCRLSDDEQALLIRMLSRKGDYFRQSQLQYDEISAFDLSASQLVASDLIEMDPVVEAEWLANFATVTELSTLVGKARKSAMVEAALVSLPKETKWSLCFSSNLLIQLTCRPAFDQFRLLFFGNLRQTLSDFIFAELGVQQFLPISVDHLCLAFSDRNSVEAAWQTHLLGEALEAGTLSKSWLETVPESPAWLVARYKRRLFQLGHQFERQGNLDDAIDCYLVADTSDARIRRLRVLERLKEFVAAEQLCAQMLLHPKNEAELDAAQKVAKRLRKHGFSHHIEATNFRPTMQSLVLPERPEHLEIGVAQALGRDVYYVENGPWQTLFFLTFAQAILAPVQGAFFHPFQRQPMDLYQEDFVERRQHEMQAGWQLLASEQWPHTINERMVSAEYAALRAMAAPVSNEFVREFVAQAPRTLFERVFQRMWFDLRRNRAGFPDLIALNPVRFYEVKGPGDQLQPHQRAWLGELSEFAEVAVLSVSFKM